jgi:dihydroneopterin aldolase
VAVAFYAVGHAVGVTEQMPAQIVVDVHEAIEFCAEALPHEVTATVSYDELRRVLRLHLEWIQFYHWAPETSESGPIVFEQFDALDYVMERVEVTNLEITREHAAAVIQAHSDYLQVMGAIHIEDPVKVEQDLAELPLLDNPAGIELGPGELEN